MKSHSTACRRGSGTNTHIHTNSNTQTHKNTNTQTHTHTHTPHRDLRNHADPNVVICIAGNKSDKPPAFNLDAADELAASINATFIRTSALTGEGVDVVFNTLTRRISDTYGKAKVANKDADVLKINDASKKNAQKQGGCC